MHNSQLLIVILFSDKELSRTFLHVASKNTVNFKI